MLKKGPCMHCKLENPIFLHNVYRNNKVLYLCTSCLLKMYRGSFCSICFEVYEKQDLMSSPKPIQCILCPDLCHFNCVTYASVLDTKSRASSSLTSALSSLNSPYVCRSCRDPRFRFFVFKRDEKTRLASIDKNLAAELLAASIISQRSMKEGVALCWQRVEEKAGKAAKAGKEAKEALVIMAELNKQQRRQSQTVAGRTSVGGSG